MNTPNVLGFILFAILLCGGLEGSCSDDIAVPCVELNPLLCQVDGIAIPCGELNHLCSLFHRFWDIQDIHRFLVGPTPNPGELLYISDWKRGIFSEYYTLKLEILSICNTYSLDIEACQKFASVEYSEIRPGFDFNFYKVNKV